MIEPKDFFFNLPLYSPIEITSENWDSFIGILQFGSDRIESVEGFNPIRKIDSTFSGYSWVTSNLDYFLKYGGVEDIKIKCRRYGDELSFFVHYDHESHKFQKIGQYPSIAAFHISEIKQYKKLLNDEKLKEFTRAIGLAANGVGIGSFVYLRRIFETLIIEAKNFAESDGVITNDDYQKVRVDERIELLSGYLPKFLVENKAMYSILSLGIHELDEKTCLAHFDTLRVGIEIILDEKLDELKKKEKIEAAKKKLSEIKGKLN